MKPGGRRVIGADEISRAGKQGRRHIEVLPGSIVTELARDSAERTGIELRLGPLERPAVPAPDGALALYQGLYRRNPKWMPATPRKGRSPVRFGKIAVVGAGGVGGNLAQLIASRDIADRLAIVDVLPGLAESLALDINHARGVSRAVCRASGGTDAGLTGGSDVVVVTAGRPRSPGMGRSDLVRTNARIIRNLAGTIRVAAPESVVVVVSNPLDEMTAEMLAETGFPRERVLGMAGTLDSARFRGALAHAAGVPIGEVEAIVIGSHGNEMVPLTSLARIRGLPVHRFVTEERLEACRTETRAAGARVLEIRRTASASVAPAHAAMEILDHMRGALVGAVPVTVRLEGDFGISDVALGVPCVLGAKGLIEVDTVPLSAKELADLRAAAAAVRSRIESAATPSEQ